MFFHTKQLQYNAKPTQPAPMYAKMLQELVGGQFGEMTVMMQYLFQGWNCRGPAKYRDMLLDIGTEEIAHVEMLSTMIARLLEGAPVEDQEQASQIPVVGAIMGGMNAQNVVMAGMNPQHLIVSGQGAMGVNSAGVPWNAGYIVASGNLLADFRSNLNAESQGRLQAVRLYEMTDDAGVRDMLSFLIARDTMHQNQWLAAIADLEAEGLGMTPVPSTFPQEQEKLDVSYQFWNLSTGEESSQGRWAKGPSPDGKGEFQYLANPQPLGEAPEELSPADLRLHGTNKTPMPPMTSPGPDTGAAAQS